MVHAYARGLEERRWRGGYQRIADQVSGARVLEQIAAQMRNKKCRWLTICAMNLTTRTRPVWCCAALQPRGYGSGDEPPLRYPDLEKSYRINLNMIGLDGRPR